VSTAVVDVGPIGESQHEGTHLTGRGRQTSRTRLWYRGRSVLRHSRNPLIFLPRQIDAGFDRSGDEFLVRIERTS